ncbi:MAG: O-antigen ligase family protein [Bacteriovoracaceae bacterium]
MFRFIGKNKTFFPLQRLPGLLKVLILGHFIYFVVSLFNAKGIGVWLNLPMIKVYIFPFLIFFLFIEDMLDVNSKDFRRMVMTICILVIINGILSIQQFQGNTPFMLKMSQHYGNIGKLGNFTKLTFRPYGTTYVPGGITTYLYLVLGVFFLCPPQTLIFMIMIALSLYTVVICQVRTAIIQYIALFLSFSFIYLRYTKIESKKLITYICLAPVMIGILYGIFQLQTQNIDKKLMDNTLERFSTIFESKTFEKSRLGYDDIAKIILKELDENPLGLGPGRTHAVTVAMAEAIESDPIYNLNYSWNYDNLWVTIIFDFGWGGIFYASILILMPIYLLSMCVDTFRRRKMEAFKKLLIAFITIAIIDLSNWGGVGIPYNPVSFMYWFWCAVGFQAYYQSREESEKIAV